MELEVSDLQIAPLLAIAARWTVVPCGFGLLNGELTITGAGTGSLDIIGSLDGTDLARQAAGKAVKKRGGKTVV